MELKTALGEIRALAETLHRVNLPSVPDRSMDHLKSTIAEVSSMLDALPDRIAQALTVALRTQHKLIIDDVRSLLSKSNSNEDHVPPTAST